MDILFWIILGFVVFMFISRMLPVKGVQSISTNELREMLSHKNKQFIDVRTPGEYQNYHIKQFKSIPLNELQSSLKQLDKTKETVLICQSGMRSLRAAKMLKKAGFIHITNVTSGMNAWKE